ncbi:hypothetical protein SAMN04488066_10472 [Halorubrum aquaticum]|uniref:Uncharacterized protein n=1 Tax=Halorubrum aquaticum TaxID=387340 RepID=A0A1I3A219_9EURY|nr:hypothetical protein [Halorubrum aquaticum]SFH44202.1 hypothetical protein SAMN04488066_10472 [Halorubrum aquaticum]
MSVVDYYWSFRDWFPVPQRNGRFNLIRWVLLEADRLAVTGALLSFMFSALMLIGSVWPFEMQRVLTETPAVQSILSSLLSGIILLVSIVVSINSTVLSHDITSVETQGNRIQGVMQFRRDVGRLAESGQNPTDPASFLDLMASVIHDRANAVEGVATGSDEDLTRDIQTFVDEVIKTVEPLGDHADSASGTEFGVLWIGLETEYGTFMDRSRTLRSSHEGELSDTFDERLDDLIQAFQLFATGKEYFKTLYYTREVSQLSRTLLVVSLPSILVTASAILAINAELLPDAWVFGLPPLMSFVATVFTIALAPFLVLTAYMLRLTTVAQRTAGAGPFSL